MWDVGVGRAGESNGGRRGTTVIEQYSCNFKKEKQESDLHDHFYSHQVFSGPVPLILFLDGVLGNYEIMSVFPGTVHCSLAIKYGLLDTRCISS